VIRKVQLLCAVSILALFCGRVDAANVCARDDSATAPSPAGGCGSTQANMGAALAAAVEGDAIVLRAQGHYTGHWTMPDKGMTGSGITITTDTATANLPAAGVRATLAHIAFMPILQSDTTSNSVFTAARGATSAAERYTLIGLYFKSNPGGYGNIVSLGTNDCDITFCEEFASQEPDRFTIDRCVFVADPITGQKRGVDLGGTNLTVMNSSFYGMAAFGQDSQCIGGVNGHGPWTILNNYCEASTENILFGGDDARIRTVMTVVASPAPTTTSARVNVSVGSISGATHTMAEVAVGDHLAVLISGGTARCHTTLRSKSGSGASNIDITFDPCAAAPDSPGDIRAGVTVKNVTVRRNYLTKPLSWLNPIINAPTNVNATPNTASGSLAAGTYSYTLVALNTGGYQGQTEYSNSQTVTCTLSATGKCTISWIEPSNASHYQVYGRNSSGVTQYWQVAAGTTSLDDTGSAGTAATSVPRASYWQIKNLLQVKGCQSCQFDSNVLDYQWAGSDQGSAIWVKSNNQSNSAEFNWSKDIVLEKNVIRHVDGCLSVSGQEPNSFAHADDPGLLTNFTFRNNLCIDSGAAWALAKGGTTSSTYAIQLNNSSANTVIDHNTLTHNARGFVYVASGTHTGLKVTNNLALKNSFGIFCDQVGEGAVAGCGRAPAWVVTANAIAGISTSAYPAGNFGPTVAAWQAEFVNYTQDGSSNANGAADYHLLSTSTYHNAGTDSTDLGADINAVLTATSGVTTGGAETSSAPPSITTTSLPNGTVSSAYTAAISAQGTGTITFALVSGTLPTGLSLASSGAITGTPSVQGTSTFTVSATDGATALSTNATLSITVDAAFVNVSISTTSPLTGGVLGQAYAFTLVTSGGKAPFTWTVTSGSLPNGLALTADTGLVTGTPTQTGVFTFTATVVGSLGTSASKSLSITIAVEDMPAGRGRVFNGITEAATLIRPDCTAATVRKGDLCSDSSGPRAKLRIAGTATGGVGSWDDVGAQASSHNLLSMTHSDTVADTPQEGDLQLYSQGKWRRFGLGPAGSVLTSDGTTVAWAFPTASSTGGGSTYVTFLTRDSTGPFSLGAVPAGKQEIVGALNGWRAPLNLTGFTKARMFISRVNTTSATALVYPEYSTDGGTTWAALDGTADGSLSSLGLAIASATRYTPPFQIAPAARTFVLLRAVTVNGNGVVTPTVGNIGIEFE
jgi:hypothetical protein